MQKQDSGKVIIIAPGGRTMVVDGLVGAILTDEGPKGIVIGSLTSKEILQIQLAGNQTVCKMFAIMEQNKGGQEEMTAALQRAGMDVYMLEKEE